MSRRALMVDADGVAITHPDPEGWSANLERDLGVPSAALQTRFFEPHWEDIVHGRAALSDHLSPFLAEMAPAVSYEKFVDYWFSNDAHINDDLIAELKELRAEGLEVYLATVQEHERARYLWEHLNLKHSFDGMYYAAALGCTKPSVKFYRAVEAHAGL